MWTYRDTAWSGTNLDGFEVEASDGGIGKVDEATNEVDGSYIVVDTGPWIFGKKVLLPGGVIETVDFDEQKSTSAARRTRLKTARSSTRTAIATRPPVRAWSATTAAGRGLTS
jgi:hypothetical protein